MKRDMQILIDDQWKDVCFIHITKGDTFRYKNRKEIYFATSDVYR